MQPCKPSNLPLQSLDWPRLVPLLGAAHEALAYFDALLKNIPDAELLLSPLTTQEAVLSSRIEGTQATLEEVLHFQAEGKAQGDKHDDIQEVINYRKAVDTAFQRMKTLALSIRLLKEAHEILLSGVRGQNKDPGQFRKIQVHIGKPGASREQARYVPPEAQQIPQLFSNLEKYMHQDEKDVLVQLAIVHAQFEIIHPFLDGNGRIGRLLMPLFLYHKNAISAPYFYLSEYLEKNRSEYYDRLNHITARGDWEQWIAFFLRAVSEQARINASKAQAIINLKDQTLLWIQKATRSPYIPQITNFIFSAPRFTGASCRHNAAIPRPSGARLLNLLEKGGIIEKIIPGRGRRSSVFIFPALLKIIG